MRCSGDCAGKAARSSMRERPLRAPQENITALLGQDKKNGKNCWRNGGAFAMHWLRWGWNNYRKCLLRKKTIRVCEVFEQTQ